MGVCDYKYPAPSHSWMSKLTGWRVSKYRSKKEKKFSLQKRKKSRLFRGDRDSRNIFSLSLFSANDRPISQKRNSLLHQTERVAAARHVHPIQDNTHTRGYFSRPRRRRKAARTRDGAGMSFCFATFGCLDLGAHSIIWRRRRRPASRTLGGLQTGVSPCHQIVSTMAIKTY